MPVGNPMGLTWPIVPAPQPGATNGSGQYDLSTDIMTCPICNTTCRRIGSTNFDWLCSQSHQFTYPVPGVPGTALFLGSTGTITAFVPTPGAVRNQRGYT